MYYPALKDFLKFCREANVVPVYKEINADLDTPVSAFLKLKKDDYAFLLESVEGAEKVARYSFLGSSPSLIIKSKDKFIEITHPKKGRHQRYPIPKTPLDEIRRLMQDFKAAEIQGLPRFYGGLVGYFGYDMVRFFERIPDKNPDDLKLNDAVFMLTDTLLIFDHSKHSIKIVNNVILPKEKISKGSLVKIYHRAINKVDSIHREILKPTPKTKLKTTPFHQKPLISSNLKKSAFKKIVLKAKDYIRAGDIIQVVLSQRFKLKVKKPAFDIYRDLRRLNPSPYMFFLKLKDVVLIGSSPEMLVRCEEGIVCSRPIAGTRPRGKDEKEDKRLENELLSDSKEKAEHIMLVDLGRNDLGRVCKSGSIEVSEFMKVERYSHVMHLVSEVKGILDRRYDIYDCLAACFPAGTVTGSPKIRAMEIIDELENIRRGPYAGCVGYFSFSHNMDTCITIRTIIIKDGIAYVQAGAGIVADSHPEKEYFESVNKAKALIEAILK
ncbi:MAG: anthranilate synthase component I [Candidatus Omnitrophica bacterium]|nr:anthranilate synthase component I [Candidatus Omnitrophota bacterium]